MTSIWEKFKSIFREEKKEELKKETEKMSIEELYSKIEDKLKESSKKKEALTKELVGKISLFEENLRGALETLENVDLSKRKEHEKLKTVVMDNYNLYCNHIKKLMEEIGEIKKLELMEMMKKLSLSLNNFGKRSAKSFEKATILIGEEMANTRKIINEFIREMNEVEKENTAFFEELNQIREIKEIFSELKENTAYQEEKDRHINQLKNELEKMKVEYDKMGKKIEEIKKSETYEKDLRIKAERGKDTREIERDFQNIKQKIDLKLLAKYFHLDEKKSGKIKDYANNFRQALGEDENLEIIELVKAAQGIEINELKGIKNILIELNKPLITESDRKISEIEKELQRIKSEINLTENNIEDETKKREKLNDKRENILVEIIKKAGILFPNIVVERKISN